jgi:hypothetical protein
MHKTLKSSHALPLLVLAGASFQVPFATTAHLNGPIGYCKAIKANTGVTVPPDNKNSTSRLRSWSPESKSVADVTYLGVTFAIQGAKRVWLQHINQPVGRTFLTA